MSELIPFLCLKLYSLNFAMVIRLIRIHHTCVALIRKKTVLTLKINFQFIKCVKENVKCLPLTKTNREHKIFGHLKSITIFDNFLPFAKSGRPIRTLFLPFLDQKCAQTKMQQHIDFPMEISVLKFQAWPDENPLSYVAFLNDQRIFWSSQCLRLQFRPVGSSWQ